jgi:hypothetical protein
MVDRLQKFVFSDFTQSDPNAPPPTWMSPAQVKAATDLIKKVCPDMKSLDVSLSGSAEIAVKIINFSDLKDAEIAARAGIPPIPQYAPRQSPAPMIDVKATDVTPSHEPNPEEMLR